MAFFESSNPTLSQKIFDKSAHLAAQAQGTMSVRGTINKFGFLMFLLIAGAAFTWQQVYTGQVQTVYTYMIVGAIGCLALVLAVTFKPNWAMYLAPVYAILKGFLLGGLSAFMNEIFAKNYPGLVLQAVGLTFGVAIAMFLLYNFRIIKVTNKLRSVIIGATLGIFIFYLIVMVIRLFGGNVPFMSFGDSSLLGIGISLFVVAIAALNLLLDFDQIEQGAATGAPKFMEWYGAFGLLVTIAWLYLEMLRLLSRFASRD
jgi:uncharacterized YccA/Bax inhibitor family protein